ncbi:heterokaryon incompatibility protein-domain-containing protein [Nemania sp. FL0916]|nr:heterokaryon incompatibility protein-domain-containing protein [Nemania sp. FL0916]
MHDPRPPHYPACYRPLPRKLIRVFEIEAGHFSDPIVGRLVHQTIDGEPYEAVSYVWGDTQDRHDIAIDGATLSITASLHAALTAFRHRPLSGPGDGDGERGDSGTDWGIGPAQRPVRRLWADAVCINQEDLPERTSQIELMGRIFAGARRVLAWLGWEQGQTNRRHMQDAIRFIHVFMEDPEAGLHDARILLHHHQEGVAGTEGGLALVPTDERRRLEEQARKWEDIKVFFETEYFHRTWIVQELGLAREAIMCTALKPAGGAETTIRSSRDRSGEDPAERANSKNQALELDIVDWPMVGRFVRFLDYSGASLVTHLGLQTWVAHHILMVWEKKEDGTPDCDFLTGMHWTRILGVTDARDRVYSLLGHPLAIMDGDLVIKPDYTVTRGVMYTRLAATFIQKTKNLYAVNLVDHEDDPSVEARQWDPGDEGRMPSWVPDWHSINRTTPLHCPVDAAEAEDGEIRIEGEIGGAEGTPLPHLLARGWVVDKISAVSRRMETTDFPVTNLTRERAKANPFWLDRLWDVIFPAAGDSSMDADALAMLEALSLALALGTRAEDQPEDAIGGSAGGPKQTLNQHHGAFAAYVLEYHELRHTGSVLSEGDGITNSDSDNKSNNDNDSIVDSGDRDGEAGFLPVRSLYDRLPTAVQDELRQRAAGTTSRDWIECMTWPSMCRIVYRTTSGLIGMGSRVTRPGDLVCRVRGSRVLMTMRPIQAERPGDKVKRRAWPDPRIDPALTSCAHIGPTIAPACIKRDVVDGVYFNEKPVYFRII